MKYECYFCGREIETNDIFATVNIHIENGADEEGGDILETLLCKKICSICARPMGFNYLRRIIEEGLRNRKEYYGKENIRLIKSKRTGGKK